MKRPYRSSLWLSGLLASACCRVSGQPHERSISSMSNTIQEHQSLTLLKSPGDSILEDPSHMIHLMPHLHGDSGDDHQIFNFEFDFGGIPNDNSPDIVRWNTLRLNETLKREEVSHNATLIFPANRTFFFFHDIHAAELENVVFQIDAHIKLERNQSESIYWDVQANPDRKHPMALFYFYKGHNITLTSSNGEGRIDGNGPQWWGIPFWGYLQITEHRPYLMEFNRTTDLTISNLLFKDSPLYTMRLESVNQVEIHDISIISRRTNSELHTLLDLSAFNTDGIDVSGHNVWVHDVDIWTQDDCVAVKDNMSFEQGQISSNMTFERIRASGTGFVIGSIGRSEVRNITFRDSYLYKSFKGIYMKFRSTKLDLPEWWMRQEAEGGLVRDIVFENITMEAPEQWAIWIGPAQQSDSNSLCHANPCSLCWPYVPFAKCHVPPGSVFENITLRDVTINNPQASPGVIMGDSATRLRHVEFESVRVTRGPPLVKDPKTIFRGLNLHVHDRPVQQGIIIASCLATMACLSLVALLVACQITTRKIRKIRRRRRQQRSMLRQRLNTDGTNGTMETAEISYYIPPDYIVWLQSVAQAWPGTSLWRQLLAISGLIGIALSTLWFLVVKRRQENISTYFLCQGVSLGKASGATWPVPGCFQDATDPSLVLTMKSHVSVLQILLGVIGISAIWGASRAFMEAFRMPPLHNIEYPTSPAHGSVDQADENDGAFPPESHDGYIPLSNHGEDEEPFSTYVENHEPQPHEDASIQDADVADAVL